MWYPLGIPRIPGTHKGLSYQRAIRQIHTFPGPHSGPCDTGSLHQFGDLFAPIATKCLSGKLSKIQSKLVKRKSLTAEVISAAVEESAEVLKVAGVDESRRTELSKLLRRCLCCPDFKRTLRPEKHRTIEDTIGTDESSVPAGVDLERFSLSTNRNRLGASVVASFEPSRSFSHLETHPYSCYIYNLPLRVNEDHIRRALRSIGDPTDIFLYDTRGIPVVSGPLGTRKNSRSKQTSDSSWMRFASPINAIVRFGSQAEFARASRLENKLFGIQCKSTDLSVDSDRAMLMEPVFPKNHLLVSGFPKGLSWSDFKSYMESLTDSSSIELSDQQLVYSSFNGSDMFEHRLDISFPSFEVAFEVLKRTRNSPLDPSIITAFSRFRSKWSDEDKQFTDSVYFEINSES